MKKKVINWFNKRRFSKCLVNLDEIIIGPDYPFSFTINHPQNLCIGNGCVFNGDLYINAYGSVSFGKYCHVAKGLTIFSSNHNWHSTKYLPYDAELILKPVSIGDAVWIGTNVTILPGVKIGDAAIIAAGSVVVKNVEPGSVVGGNPAKIVSKRNMELTNSLLLDEKFF